MHIYKVRETQFETCYLIALDKQVLVVASVNKSHSEETTEWCAYIGAVFGNNHEEGWERILKQGTKLPRKIAEILFPDISKTHRWRS